LKYIVKYGLIILIIRVTAINVTVTWETHPKVQQKNSGIWFKSVYWSNFVELRKTYPMKVAGKRFVKKSDTAITLNRKFLIVRSFLLRKYKISGFRADETSTQRMVKAPSE